MQHSITSRLICVSILFFLFSYACSFETKDKQPSVLKRKAAFNLDEVNFQEDVPQLYSEEVYYDKYEYEYDSINKRPSDEALKYRISNYIIDAMRLEIPKTDFGYCYKTPTLDSVAIFYNLYFDRLNTLTDKQRQPIAYYAEAELKDPAQRLAFMKEFIEKYGQPKYMFCLSSSYDVCSYEWELENKTIQITTSYGFSMTISTEETSNGKYYKLDLLIIDNNQKKNLEEAHTYDFGDFIEYNGEKYSPKDLSLDRIAVFEDDFTLNSSIDKYQNDPYGLYQITRSPEYGEPDHETSLLIEETDIQETPMNTVFEAPAEE